MATASVQSPWLKATEARAYLRMDCADFSRKLNTGEIRSVKRGNTRFCKTTWLDEWMESLPSGAKVPEALSMVASGRTSTG